MIHPVQLASRTSLMPLPAARENDARVPARPNDHQPCADARTFADMALSYRMNGGLVDGDALAGMLRPCRTQPVSWIARQIVSRRIVSFGWQTRRLVPMFQFQDTDLALRADASAVIEELADVLDDWELARWFAFPSEWLDGSTPVATLVSDPLAVLAAARADRFVAKG